MINTIIFLKWFKDTLTFIIYKYFYYMPKVILHIVYNVPRAARLEPTHLLGICPVCFF